MVYEKRTKVRPGSKQIFAEGGPYFIMFFFFVKILQKLVHVEVQIHGTVDGTLCLDVGA